MTDSLFIAFQTALAGQYSLDRELGRGGMGIVYLAREVHLDRSVAIKLLPPELSARLALRERFLREAQLAAKLSHPHIIPIHTVSECDGFVFYVMAYVEGETLAQRVQSRGPLSATDAIRLLREVAWALGHAHAQGLVHRDVKPDNILIEHQSGRALVADFGIAAAVSDVTSATDTNADNDTGSTVGICGTPEFMSPEQALGNDVDARSDLYSLGVTAFYALSGRLPFTGSTPTEVLARHITERAPFVATVGTSVPRKLAQLVDRCLDKNPANRPASAHVLAEQLGVAIERRKELPPALRAFVKRNGRMNGGGTLSLLLGALGLSVATSATAGPTAAVVVLLSTLAIAPVVFGITVAKRLLDQGFTHADIMPAFRSEQELSREERSIHKSRAWSAVEWGLRKFARVCATTGVVLVPIALVHNASMQLGSIGALSLAALAMATVASVALLAMAQRWRDVDVEFWTAAWTGEFGTLAFAAARKFRGTAALGPAMTHRATELSLGMAAEQLFDSLPKASRDALGDIPALLQRLQHEAQVSREQYTVLQETLSSTSDGGLFEDSTQLTAMRDAVYERVRETVGALETIRLSLLRLHAGSLSLEGVTTHMENAASVSEHVERLIAAQQEVESVLRFPHAVELTPV